MASFAQQPSPGSSMKPAPEFDEEAGGGLSPGVPVFNLSQEIRAGFIRKVYGILSIQLLFTVASAAFFMFHEPTRLFVLQNEGLKLTAAFAPFGFLLALSCYKDRHPLNLGLLAGFTLCLTYTVGVVCAMYYQMHYGQIVLQALVLTAAVFVSLTFYVMTTKKDFSFLGGALFSGLIILLVWSFMNSLFDFGLGAGGHTVFSLMGALLFVGYILYDTSLLLHHFGPDDYIIATVTLYLDIINLFIYLLELLRMLQGGDN